MKISKLFHWLYAVLMFLPVSAIGVTCLVNVFNKTYEPIENYKYETNEVTQESDLINGRAYHFHTTDHNVIFFNDCDIQIIYDSFEITTTQDVNIGSLIFYSYDSRPNKYLRCYETNIYIDGVKNTNETFYQSYSGIASLQDYAIDFDFIMGDTTFQYFKASCFTPIQYNPIVSISYAKQNNIFYYAIEQVENSNLFNWANESFLVAPFAVIFGLFGVPTNSIIMLMLSYWLSITLIWLVFDLIMYLPNLVHSWIDKGGIE